MNFYSDKIINDITDNSPLEEVIDSIDTFKLQCKYFLTKYSFYNIYHKYTSWILNDPNVIIAFYCMDNEFNIENCPSMLVYRKIFYKEKNEYCYYILFTCTKRSFRGQGYGTILLDNLQERIKEDNTQNRTCKIILSSIEEAVLFYEAYGFRWTRQSIIDHPILVKYESYQKGKEYFIMELVINK